MNIKVFTDDWSKLADTDDVYAADEEIFISDISSKNKDVIKEIVVPQRLVNFVVK